MIMKTNFKKTIAVLLSSLCVSGVVSNVQAAVTTPCSVTTVISGKIAWAGSQCTAASLDVHGTNFSGATFLEVNGQNANFSGTNFTGATIMQILSPENSNFTGANFSGANFTNATVSGSNFTNANFSGANFTGGKFSLLNFSGANLTKANFSNVVFNDPATTTNSMTGGSQAGGRSKFVGATLTSANFGKANVSRGDFSRANLTGASFLGATITGASFNGANLTNAIFNNVDFSGVDLTGATLTGADFSGARWSDGTICTPGNLGMCQPPFLNNTDLAKVVKWINDSVASANTPFCYLNSWGRGAGEAVSYCPPGKSKEGGLCYDACRPGYSSDGATICYQNCPGSGGWTATLTSCTKPSYYDRGIGIAPEIDNCGRGNWKCDHYSCKSNRQLENGMCYEIPREGFKCTVTVCTPRCPDGMTDFGVGCTKHSYNRGVGGPMTCQPDQEMDASLCYKKCGADATGVGPVCWQNCPSGTKACGAGCAASAATCASTVTDMIMGPATMAMNVLTFGVSSTTISPLLGTLKKAATTGADTFAMIDKTLALNSLTTNIVSNFDKMVPSYVVTTLNANFGPRGKAWIAREYGLGLVALAYDVTGTALSLFDMVDITGVTGTITAFKQPTCTRTPPFPSITVMNKS